MELFAPLNAIQTHPHSFFQPAIFVAHLCCLLKWSFCNFKCNPDALTLISFGPRPLLLLERELLAPLNATQTGILLCGLFFLSHRRIAIVLICYKISCCCTSRCHYFFKLGESRNSGNKVSIIWLSFRTFDYFVKFFRFKVFLAILL